MDTWQLLKFLRRLLGILFRVLDSQLTQAERAEFARMRDFLDGKIASIDNPIRPDDYQE